MNQHLKLNGGNPLNLILIIAILFATFGCSEFTQSFKESYQKSYDKASGSNSSSAPSESGPGSYRTGNLATKMVGGWVGRSFDNTHKVEFGFDFPWNDNGDWHGVATTKIDGVIAGKENFRAIDSKTIEFETQQGMRYRVTVEISNDNEQLTMITANGITTKFQRQ